MNSITETLANSIHFRTRMTMWICQEIARLDLRRALKKTYLCQQQFYSSYSNIIYIPGMVNKIFTWHKYWHIIDNRHLLEALVRAIILSATSFWNVRVSWVRPWINGPVRSEQCFNHLIIKGVDILKGKLPIIYKGGGSIVHSWTSCLKISKWILISI